MTAVATAEPVKKVRRKANKKSAKKTPVFETIERLMRRNDLVGTAFTIHRFDGTRKVQTINKQFALTERGTTKSPTDLLKDMNAIVHDDRASHFTI